LIQADQAIARLQGLETPTISITVPDPTASENSDPAQFDPGQFIVSRTSTPSTINRDLIVNYTFAGTATNGSDYVKSGSTDLPQVPLNGTVLIPAGSSTAPLSITAVDDTEFEPNETLEITLSENSTYNINNAQRQGTVTIVSNDLLTRRLAISGNILGVDGETLSPDEKDNLPFDEETTLVQIESQTVLNKQLLVGGEVRVEILLRGKVIDDFGNVQIEGVAKLFEALDPSTNELEDEKSINFLVPRGQKVPVKIDLVNKVAIGGNDRADINFIVDNTLNG
jgi:Calx-beta domain